MSLGIRKDDNVYVMTGKEKGKKGRVLTVNRSKGSVLIEKLNIIKKHMKPNKKYAQGGIIEKEGTLPISNVALVCAKCTEPVRVGKRVLDDGSRVRVCRKCGETLDD